MKIVFITPKYIPSIGGVETHVQKVSNQLVARGHQVIVVTSQTQIDQPLAENIDSIKVLRIPMEFHKQKIETWRWIIQNGKIFVEANVVHAHDVVWWLMPLIPMIRKKLFATFHGWEGQWPIRWHRLLLAKLSKKTIHIGAWIGELYWDRPSLVLYGGVDRRSKHSIKTQLKPKHTKILKLVFIGRLVKENDIALYCHFLAYLHDQNIGFRMQWIGGGAWKAECEKYGSVTGMVKTPEDHVAKADVVLASSYLSILLARSLGKPVWSLYSNHLKQRYLETLPNTEAMLLASSPMNLFDLAYDAPRKAWKNTTTTKHYSQNWPPTWEEVATEYEKLWNTE